MAAYEAAGETDEWFTPRYIFNAIGERFDLDVACPPDGPRHVPTSRWLSSAGLETPWSGFVWMNPPFGHQRTKRAWLAKFFAHGDGIALLPDRTSAPWFQEYGPLADAICWVSPKIKFERPDGSRGEWPGTGTALFAAGERATAALIKSRLGFVTTRPQAARSQALDEAIGIVEALYIPPEKVISAGPAGHNGGIAQAVVALRSLRDKE